MARRTLGILHRLFPDLKWKLKTADTIYLTFDDGPTPEVTDWVLDELSKRNIPATFFVLGKKIESGVKTLKRALGLGCALGNHTYLHEKGWSTPDEIYYSSIDRTQGSITKLLGVESNLFRPPYGRVSYRQMNNLKKDFDVIMWSLMAYDFDQNQSPQVCYDSLVRKTRSGDIVVFHDNEKSFGLLKQVLPAYLDYCLSHGYKFEKL